MKFNVLVVPTRVSVTWMFVLYPIIEPFRIEGNGTKFEGVVIAFVILPPIL